MDKRIISDLKPRTAASGDIIFMKKYFKIYPVLIFLTVFFVFCFGLVELAKAACATTTPTVTTLAPTTQTGNRGVQKTYSITVKNNDGTGCSNNSFNFSPGCTNCGSGWTYTLDTNIATIANGATVTIYFYFTSAADAPAGNYSGWVRACHRSTYCANASPVPVYTVTVPNYTLSVAKDGTGSGTITSSPAGIDCGSTCSASFSGGTSVTLTATTVSTSTFAGWSGGGCSGTGTCAVIMNAATSVTATFNLSVSIPTVTTPTTTISSTQLQSNQAALTGNITITGGQNADLRGFEWGTISGSYTTGSSTETGSFGTGTFTYTFSIPATGTIYYYRAMAHNGGGWGKGEERKVVIYQADGGQQSFTTLRDYTLAIGILPSSSAGNASSSTSGINCGAGGAVCSASYLQGTVVNLTATPAAGYSFSSWSGCDSAGGNMCMIVMNSARNATSTFSNNPPTCSAVFASPAVARAGELVTFTGYATDTGGSISYYQWDFGCDGWDYTTVTNTTTHTYNSTGTYSFRLRVVDNGGASSTPGTCPTGNCTNQITVNPANDAPIVSGQPATTSVNYCFSQGTGAIWFGWVYHDDNGDSESRYDFQIATSSDFSQSSIVVDRSFCNLNNGNDSINEQNVQIVPLPLGSVNYCSGLPGEVVSFPDRLSYGETYYWRVRVWDNKGANSAWVQGMSFSTPSNPYPFVNFGFSPRNPNIKSVITFTDNSQCYYNKGFSSTNCRGVDGVQYQWDFDYKEPDFAPDLFQKGNATTSYNFSGLYDVRLIVTDEFGQVCLSDVQFRVVPPNPRWKEIPPFMWLRNFWADVSQFLKFFYPFRFNY